MVPGQSYGYDYDGIGNRKTASYGTGSNESTITYARNDLNQYGSITRPATFDLLVRATGPLTVSATSNTTVGPITSAGDLYGLRMNSTGGQSSTTTIALQSNPSQTSTIDRWVPPTSESLEYDADGNLTGDSRWTYTWDGENRLVKLTPKSGAPNVTIWYSYDFRGRRIARKVADARSGTTTTTLTGFVYDGWNSVAEWETAATGSSIPTAAGYALRRTQIWGLDLGSGGAAPYGRTGFQDAGGVGGLLAATYHGSGKQHYLPGYDANGNIISWSTGTGTPVQRMDYDPFGNRIFEEKLTSDSGVLATAPSYGFSTKPRDAGSDLLYYGYRYYEPTTGRWQSRDPIQEQDEVNLYGFIRNDAVNFCDSLGLMRYEFKWHEKKEWPIKGVGPLGQPSANTTGYFYSQERYAKGSVQTKGEPPIRIFRSLYDGTENCNSIDCLSGNGGTIEVFAIPNKNEVGHKWRFWLASKLEATVGNMPTIGNGGSEISTKVFTDKCLNHYMEVANALAKAGTANSDEDYASVRVDRCIKGKTLIAEVLPALRVSVLGGVAVADYDIEVPEEQCIDKCE